MAPTRLAHTQNNQTQHQPSYHMQFIETYKSIKVIGHYGKIVYHDTRIFQTFQTYHIPVLHQMQ